MNRLRRSLSLQPQSIQSIQSIHNTNNNPENTENNKISFLSILDTINVDEDDDEDEDGYDKKTIFSETPTTFVCCCCDRFLNSKYFLDRHTIECFKETVETLNKKNKELEEIIKNNDIYIDSLLKNSEAMDKKWLNLYDTMYESMRDIVLLEAKEDGIEI
jgi:hypothetical protein